MDATGVCAGGDVRFVRVLSDVYVVSLRRIFRWEALILGVFCCGIVLSLVLFILVVVVYL